MWNLLNLEIDRFNMKIISNKYKSVVYRFNQLVSKVKGKCSDINFRCNFLYAISDVNLKNRVTLCQPNTTNRAPSAPRIGREAQRQAPERPNMSNPPQASRHPVDKTSYDSHASLVALGCGPCRCSCLCLP